MALNTIVIQIFEREQYSARMHLRVRIHLHIQAFSFLAHPYPHHPKVLHAKVVIVLQSLTQDTDKNDLGYDYHRRVLDMGQFFEITIKFSQTAMISDIYNSKALDFYRNCEHNFCFL